MPKQRSIFCLEGVWWGNLKRDPSVEPLLELVDQLGGKRTRHVHRGVGTLSEFEFYLSAWTQKEYRTHSLLYLAFHGVPGGLCVARGQVVGLERIEELLAAKCRGRIIHFGACETLGISGARLGRFLRNTGAAAICGYRASVGWTLSAALDLIVFRHLQMAPATPQGLRLARQHILSQAGGLARDLQFRMAIAPGK